MSSTTIDTSRYIYRVTWNQRARLFKATCVEFPTISWSDSTPEAALHGVRELVGDVSRAMLSAGEQIPEPLADAQARSWRAGAVRPGSTPEPRTPGIAPMMPADAQHSRVVRT